MRPQFQPLLRPVERSEMVHIEQLFRGDSNSSIKSLKPDLQALKGWFKPSVQCISVAQRIKDTNLTL